MTVLAIVYAGLSPFDVRPANQVEWLENSAGLRTTGDGIVHSRTPLSWPKGEQGLTIELWLTPVDASKTRLARVLSILDAHEVPALSIDQWGPALLVRDRYSTRRGDLIYREHAGDLTLNASQRHYLALVSDRDGTGVYVDGNRLALESNAPIIGSISGAEDFGGELLLFNAARGRQKWLGELYGLAIYHRAIGVDEIARHASLSPSLGAAALAGERGLVALYAFTEGAGREVRNLVPGGSDLVIPDAYVPRRWTVLSWPQASDPGRSWYRADLLLNLAGFLPLGFLFGATIARRGPVRRRDLLLGAALFGASLSLSIELAQVFLPSRVSTLTDLASNTIGAAAGCGAYLVLRRGPGIARESSRDRGV